MKHNPLSLCLIGFLAAAMVPPPAGAAMCVLDQVPAATLLVPYFELPLADPSHNVLVTVHNATPVPTVLHVAWWTDWGVPTISFDIFLTGYDMQTLDLGDAFHNGNLPITADEQSDPDDLISPHGDPSWDGDIDGCIDFFPFYHNPLLNAVYLARIRDGHSGQPVASVGGGCFGSPSPGLARGYITFDVAARCSVEFPDEPGYFHGGFPVALDDNRVFGEVTYVQTSGPEVVQSYTLPLVHVEADSAFDSASTASGATFYGRYTELGVDHREPLGAAWAAPVHNDQTVTSFVAWRDSQGPPDDPFGYTCGEGPAWLPVDHPSITCWNDQEDVVQLASLASNLPNETQRVAVDGLDLPWTAGWCLVDLASDSAVPYQSWLGVVHAPSVGGGPVSALPATVLGAACDQPPP